jgi:hypothetical protein
VLRGTVLIGTVLIGTVLIGTVLIGTVLISDSSLARRPRHEISDSARRAWVKTCPASGTTRSGRRWRRNMMVTVAPLTGLVSDPNLRSEI